MNAAEMTQAVLGDPRENVMRYTDAPIYSGQQAQTDPKLCHSCRYSVEVLIGQDGKTTQSQCARNPDPVTGKARHLCTTQRLVGLPMAPAIEAARKMAICGPLGDYWEPSMGVPLSPKPWWKFWKS